jgi:hypothetical protein
MGDSAARVLRARRAVEAGYRARALQVPPAPFL